MELLKKTKIRVTESIPLPRQTVSGLMDALTAVFEGKDKPVKVLYRKGQDLVIERTRFTSEDDPNLDSDPFLTPYQMIRQHSEIEVQEIVSNPLEAVCFGAQDLRKQGYELTSIVTRDQVELQDWIGSVVQLGQLFGVDLLYDPECPSNLVFFCGSTVSSMIRDIEKAIACRMNS